MRNIVGMSQIRDALKNEFRRNKAGLLERIKEHPLLSDEHRALILSYEDRPSKITVDKLINLYLPYLELTAPNIPTSDSNHITAPETLVRPRGKTRGKTRGKPLGLTRGKPLGLTRRGTRRASPNVLPNAEHIVREILQSFPMEDIHAVAEKLHLPIKHFHESQRTRIISLIIGKLVHRHSSVSGHNALSDADAKKVMRMIDRRYKEIHNTYATTGKSSKGHVNGVKFHNSKN